MSDDEDGPTFTKRQKVLHFGSLEDAEKQRLGADRTSIAAVKVAIEAGKEAGHINISDGGHFGLEASELAMHAEALAEFEKRKRARTIQVSTDDSEVKASLRQIGEPIY